MSSAIAPSSTGNINPAVSSYLTQGIQEAKADRLFGALQAFNNALEIDPDDGDALYNRAVVEHKMGNPLAAIKDYDHLLQMNSNDADAYLGRAKAEMYIGHHSAAIADCNAALRFTPWNAAVYLTRGEARAKSRNYPGALFDRALASIANPKVAVIAFLQAFKQRKSSANQETISKTCRNKFEALVEKRKKGKKSEELIEGRDFKLEGEDDKYLLYRGRCKANRKDYHGAIEDYNTAIRFNPKNPVAYELRGEARSMAEDYPGAMEDYIEWVRLEPANALSYNERAKIRFKLGDIYGWSEDLSEAFRVIDGTTSSVIPKDLLAQVTERFEQYRIHSEASDVLKQGEHPKKTRVE